MRGGVSITSLGPDAQRQVVEQLRGSPREKRPSKYRNVKTPYKSVQGFERVYDSKREAEYARLLDCRVRDGRVLWWLPQVRFPLPGGVTYVLDFLVLNSDGVVDYIDVKGRDTQASKNKRKQVSAMYGIDVELA